MPDIKLENEYKFLSGGGMMGKLMRSYDWKNTSLGEPNQWSESLRSALSICLGSAFPIAIYWGKDLSLLYNDAWSPIPGNKHPWALGRPGKEVWPEIWEAIEPLFTQVISTGEGIRQEDGLLLMNRHGYVEECYFDFTFSAIRGESGKVDGIFNAVVETTYKVINQRRTKILQSFSEGINKAKSTDEVYSTAAELLSEAKEDIPFCMFFETQSKDESTIVSSVRISPEQKDLFQKRISEIKPDDGPEIINDLKEKFSELSGGAWPEAPDEAFISSIVYKNKIIGYFICGISPRREYDNDYKNFLEAIVTNISTSLSNVLAFEEEKKRAEALAEIDKAKTVFFSNISHEFRTPLSLMLAPIEDTLNDPNTIPENRKRLGTAHRNALRLLKLVNSLLDFSRIEAGRVQAVFQPTDICELTKDLSSAFRSVIENAGLKYIVNCASVSQSVYVDTTMWERIVFNLLSNAFKFTFEGEISLSLNQVDDHIRLVVADTGTGIPEKELPKLFSRFHRIDKAKGRTHEGSGIGLAMVYELVKLHGGAIHVESILGKGTTFTVSLPLGRSHLPKEQIAEKNLSNKPSLNALPDVGEELGIYGSNFIHPENSSKAISPSGSKEKILLADDNADMREYLVRLLGSEYDIRAVSDGVEALKAVKEYKPSLILSDIMMPNLDGLGLLKELRANDETQAIPVIFISARAGEEAKVEGIEAGADDYLVKPFSAKELFARVQTHLNMSRIRKAAKKAAELERQHLFNLFMQAPAIIAVLKGPDHVFELANPRYMQSIGLGRDIIGKSIREAVPELEGQGFFELLHNVYQTGKPFAGNETLVKTDIYNDGNLQDAYVNFVYQPIIDVEGKTYGIFVHAVNVTEQVLIRKAIEVSEEKYRSLFETMEQGFAIIEVIFDSAGKAYDLRYLEINSQFEKHSGIKNAQGKTARELFHILENEWLEVYGNVSVTGNSARFIQESEAMGRWFEVYAFRIGNPADQKVAILFTDITERRQYEENLRIKNEELIKINNDLDNFIYTASHDLKAPVSNIEGLLNTLKDSLHTEYTTLNEDTDIVLQMIDTSISRFKNTILDLTEISKVQKSQEEDVKEIPCHQIVEDVKLTIYNKIVESNAEIKIDFENCKAIRFSKKNFTSIVYNLLSNAIKYRDPEKQLHILIKAYTEGEYSVLMVKDNGLGIPESSLKKLFGMFKRFHDHIEGSGIGLYIVKRIVDNAGGKIEVESEVGKGSTFKVYFKNH